MQGSAWVLVGLAIQALLGVAFWTMGAHVATSSEVGRASALFTTVQFINYATGLGLTVALARFATDTSRESNALFGWSVVATAVTSVVGSLAFVAFGTQAAVQLVSGSAVGALGFALYVAGVSVGLLADVRLMAARRWGWLVGRIAVVGVVRLPLVLWNPGFGDDTWLYHLILGPLAIGGWLSIPLLRWIGVGRMRFHRPTTFAPTARFALVNWVAALASTAPQFVLPLVVVANVASSTYASFFLAWTMTGMVFLVPGAISQILLVEGAKDEVDVDESVVDEAGFASGDIAGRGDDLFDEDDLGGPDGGADPGGPTAGDPDDDPLDRDDPGHRHEHQAFAFGLGVATLAWVGSLAGGGLLTLVFGDAYRDLARTLPNLVVAGIPWAFTSVRLSEARLRRDQFATIAITASLGLLILGPALLWVPQWGVAGATRAWILGNVVAALVAEVCHRRDRRRVGRRPVEADVPERLSPR